MRYLFNKKLVRLSVVLLLVMLGAAFAALGVSADAAKMPYIADEYIIKVEPGASLNQVRAGVARIGGQLLRALPVPDTYVIKMGPKGGSNAVYSIQGMSRSSVASEWLIKAIQPNYVYAATVTPDDEFWEDQWDKIEMKMPRVWDVTKGEPGIMVAVIDTGVDYEHPDLEDRVLVGLGYDYLDYDEDPMDEHGHGTHVAGIIAAQGDNGIGTVGVCWDNVSIIPLRALGGASGLGTTESVLNCLDHASSLDTPIVNMSLGGPMDDLIMHWKIQELEQRGILVVCAAGNTGDQSIVTRRYVQYPAAYPEAFAVASIGKNDRIAYYSSYGPEEEIDITAIGGDQMQNYNWSDGILSTSASFGTGWYSWDYMQGTSMACPQVSGAAALLMSVGVPALEARTLLEATARIPLRGYDPVRYGKGIMDLETAISGSAIRIVSPTFGATTTSTPKVQIQLIAVNPETVSIQIDGADVLAEGEAIEYFESRLGAVLFTLPLTGQTGLAAGTHTISATGRSLIDGELVFDESTFTVSQTPVEAGIYMFAFPYLIDTNTEGPEIMLPGTTFSWSSPTRSRLIKWIAAPLTGVPGTAQYGYATYNPDSASDILWKNTSALIGGSNWFINGGYYASTESILGNVSHPTVGSGYWLVVPSDTYVVENLPSLEGRGDFDPSKGFIIPLYTGWNIIGNPFPKNVSWQTCLFRYKGETKTLSSAVDAGWLNSIAYGYDSNISRDYRRITSRGSLEAFRGYWVRSYVGDRNDPLQIIVLP